MSSRLRWFAVAGGLAVVAGVAAAVASSSQPTDADADALPGDAVLALFEARSDASCDAYVETTTEFFRNDMYLGSATCDDFDDEVAAYVDRGPVEVRVESQVQVDVDTAEVEVVETYRAGTDEEYRIVMAYRVQLEDGAWKVDHADLTVLRD